MASLFIIQGADQGKRFDLHDSRPVLIGREATSRIRLHDHEVSRRHAEVRPVGDRSYVVADLASANGTYLNGQIIREASLNPGDRIQLGSTVLLFDSGPPTASGPDLTSRVDLLALTSAEDRSAILKSMPAAEGSRVLGAPANAGEWLKQRLANLAVMYQAIQATSHVVDTDALLPQILQLVFDSINADRGAILLADPKGRMEPKAVKWRGPVDDPDERLRIPRSILEHVLGQGQGVITTNAPVDQRFGPSQSIVDFGIREAICVPVQGRHSTLGVIYADVRGSNDLILDGPQRGQPKTKFTQEHLLLMVALGQQAGLAIENTTFYQAKLQAERLAAVGQTIATLSHHVKNILQGVKGGSYLIQMGLDGKDEAVIRRGWSIVEKNQTKITNLVMDMLSFSKDREPSLEATSLNEVVGDVVELMQTRAGELHVRLEWEPCADLPEVLIDPEGIHRAVLNLVTNALDAAEEQTDAHVRVTTGWDAETQTATVVVSDNGPGIPEEHRDSIFEIFESTKGGRGTGLGLPVSRKIAREHGGDILVKSEPGRGAQFTIELPMRQADPAEANYSDHPTAAD